MSAEEGYYKQKEEKEYKEFILKSKEKAFSQKSKKSKEEENEDTTVKYISIKSTRRAIYSRRSRTLEKTLNRLTVFSNVLDLLE